MFWGKKNKDHKSGKEGKSKAPQSREEIQAQAMENVRAARVHIGEETLDKIAAIMTEKQKSAMEQAKRQIQAADPDRVLDELMFMMNEGRER